MCTYAGIAVAVSHDEIESGTGLASVLINRAAAVLEDLLAQVCTLLCLLLKQQVSELHTHAYITAFISMHTINYLFSLKMFFFSF